MNVGDPDTFVAAGAPSPGSVPALAIALRSGYWARSQSCPATDPGVVGETRKPAFAMQAEVTWLSSALYSPSRAVPALYCAPLAGTNIPVSPAVRSAG